MKQQKINVRFRTFLFLVFVLFLPQLSKAENGYMTNSSNYRAYSSGQGVVRFSFPLIDFAYINAWAHPCTVSMTTPDGKSVDLFTFYTDDNLTGSSEYWPCMATLKNEQYGELRMRTTSGVFEKVGISETRYNVPMSETYASSEAASVEFEWYVPQQYTGMELVFSASVYIAKNVSDVGNRSFPKIGSAFISEGNIPEITGAFLSWENNQIGKIAALWTVPASKVTSVSWSESGSQPISLKSGSNSGTIYLDAFQPHKEVMVTAVYPISNGTSGTYNSEKKDIMMLHKAARMAFTPVVKDNKVQMSINWSVDNPDLPDFYGSDYWEVQRNVSGDKNATSSWTTVGMVDFVDQKLDSYTFVDESYGDAQKDKKVYYRIRRACTTFWGWTEEGGMLMDSVYCKIVLPCVANLSSERADESNQFPLTQIKEDSLIGKAYQVIANDGHFYENVAKAESAGVKPEAMVISKKRQSDGSYDGTAISLTDCKYSSDSGNSDVVNRDIKSYSQEHPISFGYWFFDDLEKYNSCFKTLVSVGGTMTNQTLYVAQLNYLRYNASTYHVSRVTTAVGQSLYLRPLLSFKGVRPNTRIPTAPSDEYVLVDWYNSKSADESMDAIVVWDSKASLKLLTEYYDSKGAMVLADTTSITDDERTAGSKLVQLSRSCLTYKFSLVEDRKTSAFPISGLTESKKIFPASILDPGRAYKVEKIGKPINLKTTNEHTYVLLEWEQKEYSSDYFQVYRSLHNRNDFSLIADKLQTMYYKDKSAKPEGVYDYYVAGVTACEGIHTANTDTVNGNVDFTGTVEGYVRMSDGTGIPNCRVTATPIDNIPGAVPASATTDSTGYYRITGLIYQSSSNHTGSYSLIVESTEGVDYKASTSVVYFDLNTNFTQGAIFTQLDAYKFTGAVYYERSSIPVVGAKFKMDGITLLNGSGQAVTTNVKGEFSVLVSKGTHTVQVFKEGHEFLHEGMLLDPDAKGGDARKFNFQKNVSGYYFWDNTKVSVKGRIAGGDQEGKKPLGKWQTNNILGDNLEMVLQLEGDNTSFIYRDTLNTEQTSFTQSDLQTVNNVDHRWSSTWERHRIVIHPDSLTGEFQIDLYPVKWKLTQASCNGYVSLFQSGKVGETYDFSDSTETGTLNFIYHAPISFEYKQLGVNPSLDYFGQQKYVAIDACGNKKNIPLAFQVEDATTHEKSTRYTFGHPVFMQSFPYSLSITAGEYYYYNNSKNLLPTVVPITDAKLSILNQLVSSDNTTEVELDSTGTAYYTFIPDNVTYSSVGDAALRSMSVTLNYNGAHYDGTPLTAYLMGAKEVDASKRSIVSSTPVLFDVLRDPPGANSYATLEKGANLTSNYNWTFAINGGVSLQFGSKTGGEYYNGLWVGSGTGTEGGTITSIDKKTYVSFDIGISYNYDGTYSYTYSTKEEISTSSKSDQVGAKADIFMGYTNQIVVNDVNAVRAIPKSLYEKLAPGGIVVLAKGMSDSDSIYLVRDKVLSVCSEPKDGFFFYYSQEYIGKRLLPDLVLQRNELLIPNTVKMDEAQAQANSTNKAVYLSTLPASDENYGGWDEKGEKTWKKILPNNVEDDGVDEIENIYRTALAWINFLAQNEKEKLEAADLVKRFDFDGSAAVSYSEEFSSQYNNTKCLKYLGLDIAGMDVSSIIGSSPVTGVPSIAPKPGDNNDPPTTEVSIGSTGGGFFFKIIPKGGFSLNAIYGRNESYEKKISFTFGCSTKSSLSVDVYRVSHTLTSDELTEMANNGEAFAIKTEDYLEYVRGDHYRGGANCSNLSGMKTYGSFVFRTRGGMTRQPYEDQRVSKYYNPGTVLDEKTVKIDKLKIWSDQAELSNVPMGQPARFTIHMTNDTDYPERTTRYYSLCSSDPDNPLGAKIMCDGTPLSNIRTVEVNPGATTTKVIEVYPAAAYDYDKLSLCLYDEEDTLQAVSTTISAHFIPAAGDVNISVPGNKWVLNTYSLIDEIKQDWYMPVRIDGFDTNFRGFDHIELQYKKSTQGDGDWINMCSFYASDSLMALASGSKKLIGKESYIVEKFYGEAGEVEQNYDIRAVEYCRYGSGFLTNASSMISGIKDTRCPTTFGTPLPTNGILGIGSDIRIPFSENIAGNNLSSINNFEVKGSTNSTNISLSSSLSFGGDYLALSLVSRNLTDKSFTVEMMVSPESTNKEMCLFSHGGDMNGMAFSLTADNYLKMEIMDESFISDKQVEFNGFHQVGFTFDKDTKCLKLYDGNKEIGHKTLQNKYAGAGDLIIGGNLFDEWENSVNLFKGNMLEFRLWNYALTPSEISSYAQKNLTGYEYGLLDNYPMSEVSGAICYDKGPGKNNLYVGEGHFAAPKGISLKLNEGVALNGMPYAINRNEDFTLMFWMKTSEDNGALISNGKALNEPNYKNHFNFGIADGQLYYRHGGLELSDICNVNDGAWHHVAAVVNRTRNVGNIYVDKTLKKVFSVDSLAGISYVNMMLGACKDQEDNVIDKLNCNMDEIGIFNTALPEALIKSYSEAIPSGTEIGLQAWLSCSRGERQSNNQIRIMPNGLSLKLYKSNGVVQSLRDTILSTEVVSALADRSAYAPVRDNEMTDNLNYSYVVKDNELVINLNEPDCDLERTNISVTVKDIADLQGNLLQSPVTMSLYVYRAPLRWNVQQLQVKSDYKSSTTFELKINNLSGKTQEYTLSGLPEWLTASETTGSLAALGEKTITFTIKKNINVGVYDEMLYVRDVDGISEPLPLTVTIKGETPEWKISDEMKNSKSMQIVARVVKRNVPMSGENDLLAAFNDKMQCVGVDNFTEESIANTKDALVYLTVYSDNQEDNTSQALSFRFYDASTGYIYIAESDTTIHFVSGKTLGTPVQPLELTVNTQRMIQPIKLSKGWNWVSFYVDPIDESAGSAQVKLPLNLKTFLNKLTSWDPGDSFSFMQQENGKSVAKVISYVTTSQTTKGETVESTGWNMPDLMGVVNAQNKYEVYVSKDKTLYVDGNRSYDNLTLHRGWNRIAYNTPYNMSIASAMADYLDDGRDGDLLKSKDQFVILSVDALGNKTWKGNLQYMVNGEGYMLYRNTTDDNDSVVFCYPITNDIEEWSSGSNQTSSYAQTSLTNMSVVAVTEGVQIEVGDRLVVSSGGETRGEAIADSLGMFFLTVGDAGKSMESKQSSDDLTFRIERDGDIVAVASSSIPYQANAIEGTPRNPSVLKFSNASCSNDGYWYNLFGHRFTKKPEQPGVYIHNGIKEIIK